MGLGIDSASKLDADHIIPICFGGTTNGTNAQYLCKDCHAKKSGVEKSLLKVFELLGGVRRVGFGYEYFISREECQEFYLKYYKFVQLRVILSKDKWLDEVDVLDSYRAHNRLEVVE
jgi:hypothetical protein